ncbi:MAG: DUF1326 domain-containing protein [Hyphomicrobiales bacterium]|nr:DUF1326 domain-containing protein [Hyphomicrobiales bacterium]
MSSDLKPWEIKGELILNCNCTVFCPCVVSLGKHPPTEGFCQAWLGVRIDEGHHGDDNLSGLNVAMVLDIPGQMSRGNWTVGTFIDENASDNAFDGLNRIFSGQARGTTGLFSLLVGMHLGTERAEIAFERSNLSRRLTVGKKIIGEVAPIGGAHPDEEVKVTNTEYWMGPDITIAQASKGRVRAFGRVWDFEGRSAEICRIDWRGP